MKKLNLLALAFVLGTLSLFATNISTDYPIIKDVKPPAKKLISDLTILDSGILYNKEINLKITSAYNSEGKLVILDMQSENEDVLMSILETLNNKRRISAIRDYAYEMPDITRKE
ncbi:MAG: hypothetical protein CVU08_04455 [Bacteroidetes bacterium HGW-Bacteroidetes-3]|nr:MAG: hypothetical protein CVU08_04455 [Bacteroidetes bacterium HGW-Bacteroidetes-3]